MSDLNRETEMMRSSGLEEDLRDFDRSGIFVLAGTSHPVLASAVFRLLDMEEIVPARRFPDNEVEVSKIPNLRRRDVVIMNSGVPPMQDFHLHELYIMLDAVKRASAGEVTALLPYMPYLRQDRKDRPRAPISAALVANLLVTAGADRLLTVDNHSPQVQGYIDKVWDQLFASYVIVPYLKNLQLKNLVVLSPDAGGVKRAGFYFKILAAEGTAYMDKIRNPNNGDIQASRIVGETQGKEILIIDDMWVSGTTMMTAAALAKKEGAQRVVTAVSHGLFIGDVLPRLSDSAIDELIVTDTLPIAPEIAAHPKVTILTVADLLARAIVRLQTGDSLSELIL